MSFATRSHLQVYSPWFTFLWLHCLCIITLACSPFCDENFFSCNTSISPDVFFVLSALSHVLSHASPHLTVYNLYPTPGVNVHTINLGSYTLHFMNEFFCQSFPLGTWAHTLTQFVTLTSLVLDLHSVCIIDLQPITHFLFLWLY